MCQMKRGVVDRKREWLIGKRGVVDWKRGVVDLEGALDYRSIWKGGYLNCLSI